MVSSRHDANEIISAEHGQRELFTIVLQQVLGQCPNQVYWSLVAKAMLADGV